MEEPVGTELKLFDAHAYLGRFPSLDVGDGSAAGLLADMDLLGIDRATVAHTAAKLYDPAVGNELVRQEISDHPRLSGCWTILPGSCSELPRPDEFVTRARGLRIVAFRAFPATHGYQLDGSGMGDMLARAADAGFPVMVDAEETTWRSVNVVARDHPQLTVVVSLVGYRQLRAVAELLDTRANAAIDLSNLATHRGLEWLVDRFGPSRLILGTGAPLRDGAEAITRLLWSDLDDASVRAIGCENWRRLTECAAS